MSMIFEIARYRVRPLLQQCAHRLLWNAINALIHYFSLKKNDFSLKKNDFSIEKNQFSLKKNQVLKVVPVNMWKC